MKGSYVDLQDNYILIREIDPNKNKKEFWLMNIGSFVLLIPFFIIYFFLNPDFRIEFGFSRLLISFLLIVSIILLIPVHELIHGLFFKLFGNGKLKFGFHGFAFSCSMPSHYFNKRAYTLIGLAPLIIISIITGALSIFMYKSDYFIIPYAVLAINFSSSIGDIYVIFVLFKYKKTVLVNDIGVAMRFYDKKP